MKFLPSPGQRQKNVKAVCVFHPTDKANDPREPQGKEALKAFACCHATRLFSDNENQHRMGPHETTIHVQTHSAKIPSVLFFSDDCYGKVFGSGKIQKQSYAFGFESSSFSRTPPGLGGNSAYQQHHLQRLFSRVLCIRVAVKAVSQIPIEEIVFLYK